MPELFDVVEVIADIPEYKLYAGMQGTIVAAHSEDAYEVEFTDESGETLALLALHPHQFLVVWRAGAGMPVSVTEQVITLMETLPESAGQEVLNFTRFLSTRRYHTQRQHIAGSLAAR